jgi:hypothetical protein
MTTHGTGTFAFTSWDEKPYSETDGTKLTQSTVANTFHGDVEGQSTLEYLMFYPAEGAVTFIGLEHITGRLGDRSGSFVLQHSGAFENGAATGRWFVLPGSGTGDLRGLRGEGGYVATHEQPTPFTLDYDFE